VAETVAFDAWQAAGLARFGHADSRLWLFVCPACGQEQTYRDLVQLGVPKPENYFAYACIGRFNLNVPARADQVVAAGDPTQGFGCLHHGGLRPHLCPVLLDLGDGRPRPTFGFAP
jgi:hypothetical protein